MQWKLISSTLWQISYYSQLTIIIILKQLKVLFFSILSLKTKQKLRSSFNECAGNNAEILFEVVWVVINDIAWFHQIKVFVRILSLCMVCMVHHNEPMIMYINDLFCLFNKCYYRKIINLQACCLIAIGQDIPVLIEQRMPFHV